MHLAKSLALSPVLLLALTPWGPADRPPACAEVEPNGLAFQANFMGPTDPGASFCGKSAAPGDIDYSLWRVSPTPASAAGLTSWVELDVRLTGEGDLLHLLAFQRVRIDGVTAAILAWGPWSGVDELHLPDLPVVSRVGRVSVSDLYLAVTTSGTSRFTLDVRPAE